MAGYMLRDVEILQAIEDEKLKISPFDLARTDLTKRSSPVQPSSLDLQIGKVFIPPKEPADLSKVPRSSPLGDNGYRLPAGHSVIVETRETITLSAEIAAFGFPPASLARSAILMTNPGHIDPGYSGKLSFTLINMGRDEARLNFGDMIVSLLIFQFPQPVQYSYDQRVAEPKEGPSGFGPTLNELAPDFANFAARAEETARKEVEKQRLSLEVRKIYIPVLLTIATAAGAFFFGETTDVLSLATESFVEEKVEAESDPLAERIAELEQKFLRLEVGADALELDERLDEIQRALDELDRAAK